MKIKYVVPFVFFSTLVLTNACNPIGNMSGNHAASPFDTTKLENQVLSAEDRALLSKTASGKTVKSIDANTLANQINASTDKLYIYCFWNLKNDSSIATVRALNELSGKFDSTKLKIVYVNVLGSEKIEDVNLFIRENQLTDETLLLQKADASFFTKKIRKDFVQVANFPVVLMANKADETMMFYNKSMDEKELAAVVNPLIAN